MRLLKNTFKFLKFWFTLKRRGTNVPVVWFDAEDPNEEWTDDHINIEYMGEELVGGTITHLYNYTYVSPTGKLFSLNLNSYTEVGFKNDNLRALNELRNQIYVHYKKLGRS